MNDAWRPLLDALDAQAHTLGELVTVTQHEQASMLAFDIGSLSDSVDRKRRVLERVAAADRAAREAFEAARAAARLKPAQAATVTELAGQVGGEAAAALLERASRIRALGAALGELAALNMVHAQRGLQTVRAYAGLLTGRGTPQAAGTYGRNGRAQTTGTGKTPLTRPHLRAI